VAPAAAGWYAVAMKSLRALAAGCAASLSLWPAAAGAGTTTPDQELTARHTYVVDGESCTVDISARRYDTVAVVTTDVFPNVPRCQVSSLIRGSFSDEETGGERLVSTSGRTQSLTLQVQQISRIRYTQHDLLFTWNNSSVVYELRAPK
jgi:hypothetical protein